jgi:hypothetical protein
MVCLNDLINNSINIPGDQSLNNKENIKCLTKSKWGYTISFKILE